ncbi:MAG: nitroreductase family deazaflavin-dependent oxidoreductase [Propionibacteriaceae bacterium]|nr:nitroreductase family deazaflavin-dependent oxidoreductase [Propionibacteriaceae bacterium]
MPRVVTNLAARLAGEPWLVHLTSVIVVPDRLLLRLSRGRLGLLTLVGMDTLVLHTVGRRSGLLRETPLLCVRDSGNDRLLIAGSNWGLDQHPAWVLNLRAGGPVGVTRRGYVGPAEVRELTGPARDEAYSLMGRRWSSYPRYAARTDRLIPVFEVRISS